MRLSSALILILGLAIISACQTEDTSAINTEPDLASREIGQPVSPTATEEPKKVDEHGHEDSAPRIELADAKKLYDSGNVIILDTRSAASWTTERIKGSINIPMAEFQERFSEVPKGKPIIAYCS